MEKINVIPEETVDEFIASAISRYVENNFSFSLWRLPNSKTVHLAASDKPQFFNEINLEEITPGFVFSPFDPSKEKIQIPADELHSFDGGQLTFSKGTLMVENSPGNLYKKYRHTPYYSKDISARPAYDNEKYKSLVTKCIDEIIRGNFEKIVPSRSKTVKLQDDFDIIETFNALCRLYPLAMVSVFSSPMTGTWVGATPEMLVGISKDQHFRTVAVAGTQSYDEGVDLRSISWTQKEIEEQASVERYIISCFKKIRLREYDEQGPKTIVAGNVLHLKTEFTVDMKATNFPQLGSIMLKLLHPTSAVCGMPLDTSLEFLKKNEGYDREFYSGYLGPVNIEEETSLYVNLRCMKLSAGEASLYAGAGVMADSDPNKEWRETEMKMNTLGRTIIK